LQFDNGGELKSHAFSTYYSKIGIKRQFIQPHTPQHNGVVERKNRTLLDIVRCLLADSNLPSNSWAKAILAACKIANLRSSKENLA
jgi:transposase InsO family protein